MAVGDEKRTVYSKPVADMNSDEFKATIDIYKMLVDMADKVSQRRQNANNFYLSVNTALVGATAYLSGAGSGALNTALISLAGMLVCVVWMRNIESYKDLNAGKFEVITEIERSLPLAPYCAEWSVLQRSDADAKRYRPFHQVEILVPIIFAMLHVAQLMRLVPWERWVYISCR
jgi:hypothetical protein